MTETSTEPTDLIYSDFTRSSYQRGDFLKQITKRMKKDIRQTGMLEAGNEFTLIDDGRMSTVVLKKMLEVLFSNRITVHLVTACVDVQERLLNSDCLDEYIQKRLDVFTQEGNVAVLTDDTPTPLRVVTAHECKMLAEIYTLQGEEPKTTSDFIKTLQEKYDQTKTSFLKSFLFLQEILQTENNPEK